MTDILKNLTLSFITILFFVQGTSFAMDEVEWSYSGSTGPLHWGEISDDYTVCFTGGLQSPIDIKDTRSSNITPIKFYYYKSPRMGLTNTHHTIEVDFGEGSDIKIGKTEYKLKQIHFHTPSEHTIDGEQYPMEIHFVHQSISHRIAVLGVFVEAGEENKFFKPITKYAPKKKGGFDIVYYKNLTPKNLIPEEKEYYKYTGSLTTPPCTEGVTWFLLKNTITLSSEQIDAISEVIGKNNRPIQPTNNRNIRESMEKEIEAPIEETPSEEAPAEEAPSEEAEEEVSADETPSEETPNEEAASEPTETEESEAPVEEEVADEQESATEEATENEVEDEVIEEEEIEVDEDIVEDIEIESEEEIEIEDLD